VVLAELLVFRAERVLDVAELVHDGRVLVQKVRRGEERDAGRLAERRKSLLCKGQQTRYQVWPVNQSICT
jgi:hypothetical protein